MIELTEKQCEALRTLEQTNGDLKKAASELGIGVS